ncbi:MAG: flagellar filament capping protein FliD [Candidatus Acidiferrales bacterium]
MGTINNFGNVLLPAGSNTIDVQTLLTAAITAAQEPLQALQTQQTTVQNQSSALQSIETDVQSLGTAVSALSDPSGSVNSLTATSSDPSLLTASADSTAQVGSHAIVINSLATTASSYTNAVASSTTAIGTGSFQIAVGGGAAATVTVDTTDNTLDSLAAAINSQNIGVTASVINDANGARLALVSGTSGASGNITISKNSTGLTFNPAATGANASLTVDGVPVDSTSNTVTGVIPGVTLNLAGAAAGTTVSLSLAPDASQATSAINSFVAAWNQVIGDLNSQFDVSADGTGGGPLEADNTLRNVQNQLLTAVTASISGNNGLVNLASIGVNLNTDGTLTVDSGTLSNAIDSNFSSVQSLLQGTGGVATLLSNTLTQLTDPSQGAITLDLQGLSQSSQDLTQQINAMQSQLTTQEQNLTNEYAQMQITLDEMPQLQSQMTAQLAGLGQG